MDIQNLGSKPSVENEKQLVCETLANGDVVKFWKISTFTAGNPIPTSVADVNLDGTPYTVVDPANVEVCAPPQIVEKTIGRERLSLDDSAAGSLTPAANADLAFFSVVSGCGYASDDGTTVLNDGTIGHNLAPGANGTICGDDMADFSAIGAVGERFEIEITYKQCVEKA